MAQANKRSWKLQDLVAHNANVNCLALGHKSGRVMVTGGDDKKVNLWAIGKQSCFMSLSGHSTPIDCVQFNHNEELVCAGSRTGALKVWDLEAAKLVRTMTGHTDAIRTVNFHPYGDFLASGSTDCAIRIWDSRKKGCIATYNGHKDKVNSIKFSPHGQWIASGGDDCAVKIWDTRMGKVLKMFMYHTNSVNCVEFHPREFLLATGSSDGSVHLYDLENYNLVSSEREMGSVRSLWFNPNGECLFAGVRDYLKVVGWEPTRLYDSVCINWGRISDISTAQNQLVGASFHLTNVMVYVADLNKIQPFGGPSTFAESPSPFNPNQSIRKSFSRAERPVGLRNRTTLDVRTIEESTSGTDPEEESSAAHITNRIDYEEIFKGRAIARTPPPDPEPFLEPAPPVLDYTVDPTQPQVLGECMDKSFEALSLDHSVNYRQASPPSTPSTPSTLNTTYARSKSNLDQVYNRNSKLEPKPPLQVKVQPSTKFGLQRQSSCKESGDKPGALKSSGNIRHSVSDVNLNKNLSARNNNSRKNSFSKPTVKITASVPNVSKIPRNNERPLRPVQITPVDVYVSPKISPDDEISTENQFIPISIDKPVGLPVDDFLPTQHSYRHQQQLPDMSETEVLGVILKKHDPMLSVLITRQRNLKIVFAQYKNKDIKAALEAALMIKDQSVIIDLLTVLNTKYSLWNLDLCVLMLPKIEELLQSKYET
ncbi:PREDICTED: katanin p80 WD40 repeat-containing subunit B1 [Nicrophorus vespilloides]|uniref:Katanin p80 WD40 repeat-containing subunit B1 n=1 Tax=Nicrophorus vespilloides TaxID=110193 RepID=A0ABM1MHL2_NICVS|nr:PREDICTED: katanin p80 WD40 repeat-containing subunit B1 [Nicrophorus vespilloides]